MNFDMTGKTVLITGATDGIGKQSALALARMGASIVGVGRNPEKCIQVADAVRSIPGAGQVDFLVCDLSLLAQVRTLAATILQKYARIDVLLNNAGAIFYARTETGEGYETTFALDHLSPFLLTNLLLDRLIDSSARVVTVSSYAHMMGKIDFGDLTFERKRYSAWGAYAQAKLANILFSNELARRTAGTGVTSNSLHPGYVRTAFGGNQKSLVAKSVSLGAQLFAITAEKGAETSVYLASAPDVSRITGAYFANSRPTAPLRTALDPGIAQQLWLVSAEMVGIAEPQFA